MVDNTIDLPGLLGARICHDMISPVGAIGNGMELLELAGDLGGPERDLITESAANANARLQLFRIAFGRAAPDQVQSALGMQQILKGYTKDSDLQVNWIGSEPVARPSAKVLMLAVLCLEAVIGRSGLITVKAESTGLQVKAIAARGQQHSALLRVLSGFGHWPDDLSPAQVQFPLLQLALAQGGIGLSLQSEDAQVLFEIQSDQDPVDPTRAPSRRQLQGT